MKKHVVIAAIAAASTLLSGVSCSKLEIADSTPEIIPGKVFTASIDQELTKTVLTDAFKVNWEEGDEISINGSIYSASPWEDATKAHFTFIVGNQVESPYLAVFPTTLLNHMEPELPAVQTYEPGKFNAPMFASSNDENLSFKNICGVVCLSLKGTDKVKSISITANEAICGEFTIDGNSCAVISGILQGQTVTLDCGAEGVQLNAEEATKFYIFLPPNEYSAGMKISVTNTEGLAFKKVTTKTAAVERSSVYTFNLTPDFTFPLNGEFSVSASKKVRFSQGNLYANDSGTGFTFGFFDNQYDFNHWDLNKNDLFTWGYGDWSTDPLTSEFHTGYTDEDRILHPADDWGSAIGSGTLWRSLSYAEWDYLITKRDGAADKCKEGVTVCDSPNCLVIAPDNFTGIIQRSYDAADWAAAEEAGLVCLPTAGYRVDNGRYTSPGRYWTSTAAGADAAECFTFYPVEEANAFARKAVSARGKDVAATGNQLVCAGFEKEPAGAAGFEAEQKARRKPGKTSIPGKAKLQRHKVSQNLKLDLPKIPALRADFKKPLEQIRFKRTDKTHNAAANTASTAELFGSYTGRGIVTNDLQTFYHEPDWKVTVNSQLELITNIIPKGPFAQTLQLEYIVRDNQIVIPATPLAYANKEQTYLVYIMDVSDFTSGGSGDIVLNVAQDGNISIPEANTDHLFGYSVCTFDNSLNPVAFKGYYTLYANLSYSIDPPVTQRDTVEIASTALKYSNYITSGGYVIFYAEDVPGYSYFRVAGNTTDGIAGNYKWPEGINIYQSYFLSGNKYTYYKDGEFSVVTTGKDISLTGWVIGDDDKYYRLNMTYTAPVQRDTVDVVSNEMYFNEFIETNQAVLFFAGPDVEGYQRFIVTTKNATSLEGNFDLYTDYSYATYTDGTVVRFTEGQLTVTSGDEGVRLTGWGIGSDDKYYRFNWLQQKGVLASDTNEPFEGHYLLDNSSVTFDNNGEAYIYAENDSSFFEVQLFCDPATTKVPSGTYVISDTREIGTALKSVGLIDKKYLSDCCAGTVNEDGFVDKCFFMTDGVVNVSYDDYGRMLVDVQAQNSFGKDITITLKPGFPRNRACAVRLVSDVK